MKRASSFLLLLFFTAAFAQTPKGSITGRVLSSEGGGLAGITVMLRPAAARGGVDRTASSDDEGNFVFEDLRPGAYTLTTLNGRAFVAMPGADAAPARLYRLGDTATLSMIRGGVLTGRVTGPTGEPVVAMRIDPVRVRDENGNRIAQSTESVWTMTDDRGIYRLFGLVPGNYLVKANGGNSYYNSQVSLYDNQAPVYYPSSPRDTAAEVQVASGGEATGVDIRFRAERGHTISGRLVDPGKAGTSVTLRQAATGAWIASKYIGVVGDRGAFDFFGVSDGEYELLATAESPEDARASLPRRVTMRGADLEGIEIRMLPLATVSGRVVIDASAKNCRQPGQPRLDEVLTLARPDEHVKSEFDSLGLPIVSQAVIGEKGEFQLRGLLPRRYRLAVNPPSESWYLKSMTGPKGAPDYGRSGVTPKSGETLRDVTLTIAEGAASLRGTVPSTKPGRQRVHLLPAEPASADDLLRYAETIAGDGGAFEFKSLAPGRYWLLARPIPADEPADRPPSPLAWDAAERAKLRREAEQKKREIELKACGKEMLKAER